MESTSDTRTHTPTRDSFTTSRNSFQNFSKPLLVETSPPSPRAVGAEELQARLRAARRGSVASRSSVEGGRRYARSCDIAYLPPRTKSPTASLHAPDQKSSTKVPRGVAISIDTMLQRIQMEADRQNRSANENDSHGRTHAAGSLLPSASSQMHRSEPYQNLSRRSTVTLKKSPLSTVSVSSGKMMEYRHQSKANRIYRIFATVNGKLFALFNDFSRISCSRVCVYQHLNRNHKLRWQRQCLIQKTQ